MGLGLPDTVLIELSYKNRLNLFESKFSIAAQSAVITTYSLRKKID